MANPIKGEVAFESGGDRYKLSYSTNALCELEDALNMSVNEIGKLMSTPEKFRMSMVRTIFWAGLIDNHPDFDIKTVGQLLRHVNPSEAIDLISRAFTLAFPEAQGGAARPPQGTPQPDGSGVNSSHPGKPSGSLTMTSGGGPRGN